MKRLLIAATLLSSFVFPHQSFAVDTQRKPNILYRGDTPQTVSLSKINRTIRIWNKKHARDLWRREDIPDFNPKTKFTIPAGGVVLLKVMPNAERN